MDNDLKVRRAIEEAISVTIQLTSELEALSESDEPLSARDRTRLAKLLENSAGEIESLVDTFEWSGR